LKGQSEVNLVFDYTGLECVGGAPFSKKKKPEAEWIKEMKDKKNEKEAGTGDDWVKRWETAKTALLSQTSKSKCLRNGRVQR